MGWNAPKADSFLATKEARDLAMGLHPGLLRWGGTVSQHKADMGEVNALVAIAKALDVSVVVTADIYDSSPGQAVSRLLAHLDTRVKVVGVELGNESYLPQYRDRITSVEDYLDKARSLRDAIKALAPQMPCGIVMAPTASMRDPDSAGVQPKYLQRWNEVVLSATWPDAVVLHCYATPGSGYADHASAVSAVMRSLAPRRVWLTEVGIKGICPAKDRKDHYDRMATMATSAGNVDLFCWHSLAGGGEHAAIRVTADRRGGTKVEYTAFGELIMNQ